MRVDKHVAPTETTAAVAPISHVALPDIDTVTAPKPLTKSEFTAKKSTPDEDESIETEVEQAELEKMVEQTSPRTLSSNAESVPEPEMLSTVSDRPSRTTSSHEESHEPMTWSKQLFDLATSETTLQAADLLTQVLGVDSRDHTASIHALTSELTEHGLDTGSLLKGAKGLLGHEAHEEHEGIEHESEEPKVKRKTGEDYADEAREKQINAKTAQLIDKANHLAATLDLTSVVKGPDVSELFHQFSEITEQLNTDINVILAKVHHAKQLSSSLFDKYAENLDRNNDFNAEMESKLNRNAKMQLKLVMQLIVGKLSAKIDMLDQATGGPFRAALSSMMSLHDGLSGM